MTRLDFGRRSISRYRAASQLAAKFFATLPGAALCGSATSEVSLALGRYICHPSEVLRSRLPPSLRGYCAVYSPYFVKFPNEKAQFTRFSAAVYPFTSLYTKNVWGGRWGVWLRLQRHLPGWSRSPAVCTVALPRNPHLTLTLSPHIRSYYRPPLQGFQLVASTFAQ